MSSVDLILINANVLTMTPEKPLATLVAVTGDRISFVGGVNEFDRFALPHAVVVDCHGKTVMPGFNDAHCHLFSLLRRLTSLDLEEARSIEEIKQLVRERASQVPVGQWIIGEGYNDFSLIEKRHPTRWDLDAAAPNHPILLSHRSLHACVLNSMALALAGIIETTPEPPGRFFERDEQTGDLNGVLYEMLGYLREKMMPPLTENEMQKGLRLVSDSLLQNGITSVQDVTISNDLKRWGILSEAKHTDNFPCRVTLWTGPETLRQFKEAGYFYSYGDNGLRFGGLKVILNEASGRLFPEQLSLNDMVATAQRDGYPVAIHAVTEEMIEAAIAALGSARHQLLGVAPLQRIEHCAECTPAILVKLKALQPVIVTQPPFVYYSGDRYRSVIPVEKHPWLYRFRSLAESGLVLGGSSDAPVVPNNPLIGIWAAATGRTLSGCQLNPIEVIAPQLALMMYTVNAAIAGGEGNLKGALRPGMLADMVVLSDNPLRVSSEQIRDIKVEMTIIGGKIIWERS